MFRSIQGEGHSQGKNSLFIRFPNCTCSCCICDSKYIRTESKEIENENIYKKVEQCNNIIFTGGEPTLESNYRNIIDIIKKYPNKHYEIETNGTLFIDKKYLFNSIYTLLIDDIYSNILFNISPKNNIDQEKKCKTEPILIKQVQNLGLNFIVKYLFRNKKDLKWIKKEQKKYNLLSNKIWVQPIGVGYNELKIRIEDCFDDIIKNNWNISARTHILLFGNKRNI